MIVDVLDQNGEESKTIGIPVKLSDTPGRINSPPVVFGSSTYSILKEFGFSEAEINTFRCDNVI